MKVTLEEFCTQQKQQDLMNKIIFPIVIFDESMNDSEYTLIDARKSYYSNSKTGVLKDFILDEASFSNPKLNRILGIINEINESMIGMHEDDIIYSLTKKEKCLKKIEKEFSDDQDMIVLNILDLFRTAIEKEKNLYFLF